MPNVRLTAPYHFAPLNKNVYFPDWADKVSHDIPFSDGEDGYIEVTLKNVSPLFIRNGSSQNIEEKEELSAHIIENGKKRYFIPGSSLRGMIRSTMESLAFGKMQQFEDRYFGKRQTIDDFKEESVSCGWVYLDNNTLYIEECIGPFKTESKYSIRSQFDKKWPKLRNQRNSFKRNKTIGWYPESDQHKGYKIVLTGTFSRRDKKTDEFIDVDKVYLFPIATEKSIPLDETIKTKFFTAHALTPGFDEERDDCYRKRLASGEKVAVFIMKNEKGEIVTLGLSKVMRLPMRNNIEGIISKQQSQYNNKQFDLCETIFGQISNDENASLKSRVQFGHAWCKDLIKDDSLKKAEGILGTPKPSFYPLYLEQKKGEVKYRTYDNQSVYIAGRKLYKVHKNAKTTPLPNNDNNNIKTKINAIPEGQVFAFRINVHNLRPIEVGAVLSALTLHETKGTYHNIGQAKGFGYGKIKIEDICLVGLNNEDKEYYLKVFECAMNKWLEDNNISGIWKDQESVKRCIQIHFEYPEDETRQMDMNNKEFRNASRGSVQTMAYADSPYFGSQISVGQQVAKRRDAPLQLAKAQVTFFKGGLKKAKLCEGKDTQPKILKVNDPKIKLKEGSIITVEPILRGGTVIELKFIKSIK